MGKNDEIGENGMTSSPIRIMHLIASNFVGGPEKQILHHAKDIQNLGYEVWIASFRDQATKAAILVHAEAQGLPAYELKSSGRFDVRAFFELARFIKREGIQLLCTHGFKANSVGVFAKALAGIPQVAFCRGWTAETFRVRVYEALERRLLPFADRIVCVSDAQAEYFSSRRWLRRRLSVVHNAMLDSLGIPSSCDREGSKVELGFAPTAPLIGAVGRLSVEKGQRFLIEATRKIKLEFPELKIVLLGEGRERTNLDIQIKRLGLEDVVIMPGFQKNVGTWMKAFDVVANCSLTEGIPNAILEAMAAGTPVVATSVGGVPALVKHEETGILVPPANPILLAEGIIKILRDPKSASVFAQNGRNWVQSQFSAAGQREALVGLYRQCLGTAVAPTAKQEAADTIGPTLNDKPSVSGSSMPFISVVMPVRNEEAHIGSVLEELAEQDYPKDSYEILVVDGESTDGTASVVREAANTGTTMIRFLRNPARVSSAGRNIGVRHSAGELIIFIDGHCHIPSNNLLKDMAAIFERTGADCLCRPQPLTTDGTSLFQAVVASVRSTPLGHGRDSTIYDTETEGPVNPSSAGAMYRRKVFDTVGYYDETFDAAEDFEYNFRIFKRGLVSYTSPHLKIHYKARTSWWALWRQMLRYGRGRFRLVKKHTDAFSFSQIIPSVFALWIFVGGALSLVLPGFLFLYGCSLAAYASLVLYFAVVLARRNGVRHFLIAPTVYLGIHLGLGFGFLLEACEWMLRATPHDPIMKASSGNGTALETPAKRQQN